MFHSRCGQRITLADGNRTATRDFNEFSYGLVLSNQPLFDNQLFEVRIEKRIVQWTGSIVIGVTIRDPESINLPACASDMKDGTWMMVGNSVLKDGLSIVEAYGKNLDSLVEGDCLGVMRTSENELLFYINGESQGIAADNIPPRVFAIVDVYGKCAQVSIVENSRQNEYNSRSLCEPNLYISPINLDVEESGNQDADCDADSGSSSSNTNLRLSLTDLAELYANVSRSLDRLAPQVPASDRLRFHSCCGSLVKISCNGRTAERCRPLDEFNEGVVMTNRTLLPDELFEIRIDRLVEKWTGSIEVGVTTHNPATLQFPATMTNMLSGTTMMSGMGILTNGEGTKVEYGEFNLDDLIEGDRIGMKRNENGDLHFYINGLDQGVAATDVPSNIWGVVDLYGMTVKVTIVNRDEREEQNLITRRNTSVRDQNTLTDATEEDSSERLQFHPRCGTHAAVINNHRTAHRPNADDDFNNGVVLTNRPLKANELFEVRLDKKVIKWAGSIEIGVTTHSPTELDFPATMTNMRSGTWMMTGKGVMQNGMTVVDEYGTNLDALQVGDRVGVMRKESGTLNFFVNGIDQGEASTNVPEMVYGVIDLYGQASQATLVDSPCSPDTAHSSISNATWSYSDMRFYTVHGRNARISNNGKSASRIRAYNDFSEAIVICNRPLREGEMFEIVLEEMVSRWSGSIEAGVTSIRPDGFDFPSTMAEIDHDTWMLSGSSILQDGVTLRNMYACDLDTLTTGTRLGMTRHPDDTLHFYLNGVDQGPAFEGLPQHVYPVIDLYGQCAKVSIVSQDDGCQNSAVLQCSSETQQALCTQVQQPYQQQSLLPTEKQPPLTHILHRFNTLCGKNITLSNENTASSRRSQTYSHGLVLGSSSLHVDEMFEVRVTALADWAGSLSIGLTALSLEIVRSNNLPETITAIEADTWYLTGNEIRKNNTVLRVNYCHSLDWLSTGDRIGLKRAPDSSIHFYLNGKDMGIAATNVPKNLLPILDLYGAVAAVEVTSCSISTAPLAVVTDMTATSAPVRLASGESATEDQLGDDYSQHSSRLHDSLENIFVEQRRTSEVDDNKVIDGADLVSPENCIISFPENRLLSLGAMKSDSILMELHDIHGHNVALGEGRRSAKRTTSYNHGVVFTARPIIPNRLFMVRIEKLNSKWVSSLMLGVTSQCPELLANLPHTALDFKEATWILWEDSVYHNGVKMKGRCPINLNSLRVGVVLGLLIDVDGLMHVFLNGVEAVVIATDLRPTAQPCHVLLDVYGQCEEVTVLGTLSSLERSIAANNSTNAAILASSMECTDLQLDSLGEKADLETHEKDDSLAPSQEGNCSLSNSHDTVNINAISQPTLVNSVGLSNCNSFYLIQEQCSQTSNNSAFNLNVLSSRGTNVSSSNSNPNSIHASSNDGVVSVSYTDNRLNTHVTTSTSASPSTSVITPTPALKISPNCDYLQACGRFKKFIGLPDGFFTRDGNGCYCTRCIPQTVGGEAYLRKGDPPVKYSIPLGWCRFPLRKRCPGEVHDNWHVAYHATRVPNVRRILDRGELIMQDNLGLTGSFSINSKDDDFDSAGMPLVLSPSIKYASATSKIHEFFDPVMHRKLLVQVAFQVLVRPGSYKVGPPTLEGVTKPVDSYLDHDSSEWVTKERGATVLHALLLRLEGMI